MHAFRMINPFTTSARRTVLLAVALCVPAIVRAQNVVACDFDIPDNRGLNVSGNTIHVVGRAGASSNRGSFYITNGNTPAGDDDQDGYSTSCNFANLFVSQKLPLINEANPALAIPAENITVVNLNAALLSGEEEQVQVQVEIPQNTAAGKYRGHITIRDKAIGAVPNQEGEVLNLDGIDVEVEVLPNVGVGIFNPDQPVPLDSLVIAGRAGQRLQGVFRVGNLGNTNVTDVRFAASDLRSESAVGLIIPAEDISFSAPSFANLGITDTARVTVTVNVPRGILGGRYRGTLTVQANGAASQTIPLVVIVSSNRGILFENNPVRTINGDIGRIAFNGDPGTGFKLAIFDMAGLLTWTTEGTVFPGTGGAAGSPGLGADYAVSVSWPLSNGVGEPVASGVYLVVVESIVNGQRQLARAKLIVIR